MFDSDGQVAANVVESVHVEEANGNHVGQLQTTFCIEVDCRFRIERIVLRIAREENPASRKLKRQASDGIISGVLQFPEMNRLAPVTNGQDVDREGGERVIGIAKRHVSYGYLRKHVLRHEIG